MNLSNTDLTAMLFVLLMLVSLAQLLGYVFVKLRQPKVVGEILAGVVLGPALLGRVPWILNATITQSSILSFVYWLGLLLLMFLSGAEAQQLFTRDERREVGWLSIVGTGIPFVLALVFGPWLIRPSLAGPNGNRISLIIILAVGVAVTSVPVVSKIFADLKILHTRFARLVLGVAVLEDIVLWLALAVATALAGKTALDPRELSYHLLVTVGFFGLGLTLVPRLIKRLNKSSFNVFAKQSPVAYAIAVLLGYCVVAGALNVSLVFAAFLAGFAVVHKKRRLFADALEAIGKVAFAFFIPVYFAIVGLKLDLIRGFSLADAGRVSDRKLYGEDCFGGTGWARLRRLSRARSAQSRNHHECTGRARHRAGQRGFRSRDHQPQVLHNSGRGGGAYLADGRRVARLRAGERLAAVDAGHGYSAGEESGHRNSTGSLKFFSTKSNRVPFH